jgi:dihydrofolate synthase/folylpolyglutamate synthase
MVKGKEIDAVLKLFPKEAQYYFTRAQIPRALPEDQLYERAAAAGLSGAAFADVNIALRAALQKANKNDLILVCGSVFVVGEVTL